MSTLLPRVALAEMKEPAVRKPRVPSSSSDCCAEDRRAEYRVLVGVREVDRCVTSASSVMIERGGTIVGAVRLTIIDGSSLHLATQPQHWRGRRCHAPRSSLLGSSIARPRRSRLFGIDQLDHFDSAASPPGTTPVRSQRLFACTRWAPGNLLACVGPGTCTCPRSVLRSRRQCTRRRCSAR
jgi:hypothetical protein